MYSTYYVLCLLSAPICQSKFLVGENLLGNENNFDSDSMCTFEGPQITYFAWMYLLVYGLQPQDVSVLYRVSLFNNCKGNVPLK